MLLPFCHFVLFALLRFLPLCYFVFNFLRTVSDFYCFIATLSFKLSLFWAFVLYKDYSVVKVLSFCEGVDVGCGVHDLCHINNVIIHDMSAPIYMVIRVILVAKVIMVTNVILVKWSSWGSLLSWS